MEAKIHEFPGWEHGPADATHFSTQPVWFPWLKLEDGKLYYSFGYPHDDWFWDLYFGRPEDIHHFEGALVKPLVIELPELPFGFKWEDAPEGTTHFHSHGDPIYCWWIKLGEDGLAQFCRADDKEFRHAPVRIEALNNPVYQTIAKHPEVARAEDKVEPVVKKQVGWWA